MKIVVSFSGGRTSAYMGWWLKYHTDHELKFVFMNTGWELPETLDFLRECDQRWNLDLVWLEAVINHNGRGRGFGTKHKVVSYETASRGGGNTPFQSMVPKYGIPNVSYPHCSRELKENCFLSYTKSAGIDKHAIAIGIRSDEVDRVSPDYKKKNLVYPLITMNPTRKSDVKWWWQQQAFDLGIFDYQGNCSNCYKKSFRSLCTIMQETPEAFEFTARMEREHGLSGHNEDGTERVFFRGNRSTEDLRILLNDPSFKPQTESNAVQKDMFWDSTGGCSESCEVF